MGEAETSAWRGRDVAIGEFVDPALLPKATVRVAAFDGENADPINGHTMGDGVRAFTSVGRAGTSKYTSALRLSLGWNAPPNSVRADAKP